MECPYCGNRMTPGALFCMACGRYFQREKRAPAEAAVIHAAAASVSIRERRVDPAGFVGRFLAYIVDSVILVLVAMAAFAVLFSVSGRGSSVEDVAWGVRQLWLPLTLLQLGYFALCEASNLRATPGKLLFGLAVTDETGDQLGLIHAVGRALLKMLMLGVVPFVFFTAMFTSKRQALYDLIVGTVVVERNV